MNAMPLALTRILGGVSFALLLLITLTPCPSVAQLEEHARVRSEAMVEFQAGRWDEARVLLRRLYAIRPSGEALRLLGAASYELRDYVGAIDYLERALTETQRPLSPDNRIQATDALAAARRFVATVVFAVVPEGAAARIQVEGTSEGLANGGTLRLSTGRYRVTAEAPGFRRRDAVLIVESGVDQRYTIHLDAEAATPEVRATRPSSESASTETEAPPVVPVPLLEASAPEERGSPAAGVSLLAGGAAVAAVGVTFVILGQADIRSVEGATSAAWSDYADRYDRGPRRTGIGIGLGLVGVAAAVIGVTLIAGRDDDQPALAVSVGTNGVALHGAF